MIVFRCFSGIKTNHDEGMLGKKIWHVCHRRMHVGSLLLLLFWGWTNIYYTIFRHIWEMNIYEPLLIIWCSPGYQSFDQLYLHSKWQDGLLWSDDLLVLKHNFQNTKQHTISNIIWRFPNTGIPPNHQFYRNFHYKASILGPPHSWTPPYKELHDIILTCHTVLFREWLLFPALVRCFQAGILSHVVCKASFWKWWYLSLTENGVYSEEPVYWSNTWLIVGCL